MQKHLLQKIAAILLVFIVVFSGFTTVFAADTEDQTLAKIQEKGVLTVGLSADYPPYEFHQTIDGKDKVVGFDVSIAEKIAKDLDVKLEIKEMNFDSLLGSLKTGKIDMIISGMSPTPERQKKWISLIHTCSFSNVL